MKAGKHMDDLHRQVLKKFHTLCSLVGLSAEEKMAIVATHGVQSSADMQTHDLIDVCGALQRQLDTRAGATGAAETMDKLRKRCLKALCLYMEAKRITPDDRMAYAKEMACRSAGKENFNRLTAAELRGVIGYFNRERETMKSAEGVAVQMEIDAALRYMSPTAQA